MKKIYIVRWQSFYLDNLEVSSGTFPNAYADRKEAEAALKESAEEHLREFTEEDPDAEIDLHEDYAVVKVYGGNDVHEWFVDEISVQNLTTAS